jgi:hypothetical protein
MDDTEVDRRVLTEAINNEQAEREKLEKEYGQVWNTTELQRDFSVQQFMAPFVFVIGKVNGISGTLMFQHSPRFYFGFAKT